MTKIEKIAKNLNKLREESSTQLRIKSMSISELQDLKAEYKQQAKLLVKIEKKIEQKEKAVKKALSKKTYSLADLTIE